MFVRGTALKFLEGVLDDKDEEIAYLLLYKQVMENQVIAYKEAVGELSKIDCNCSLNSGNTCVICEGKSKANKALINVGIHTLDNKLKGIDLLKPSGDS